MIKNIFRLFLCSLLVVSCADSSERGSGDFKGVTAHRGNSGEFPENTIPAFESAIELGVDWAELDIHRTRDGKLVVIHDINTERVGDKSLEIARSTYEELLEVDVATQFRKEHGLNYQECPPQSPPLLEDVLALFVQQKRTRISIQPKVDCVAQAIHIIEEMGARHMVGFNDRSLQYMSTVKELAGDIPVFWDRPAKTDIDEDIQVALAHGFETIVIRHNGITPEKVEKLKANGFGVGAWTVNEEGRMADLLHMGVERIYTDQPRLLIELQQKLKVQ
ncbi:hypothetical protein KUV50_16365 [Membranicola marinus]|uniref:GP-PDE domain-containing protein n=1 Tax=Membranihabitans marinus TaxID=1227546 RepID=A0A953LEA3_9BACT|nr:glycerophosphodiester phosphodiesterase family protein [Membranihabitans marinus]MBY5959729.1 hypothetical protein [Membranihabitans marinus]